MVVIAETTNADLLHPFSILHAQWELRVGFSKLFERTLCGLQRSAAYFTGRSGHCASFRNRRPNVFETILPMPLISETYRPNTLILRGNVFFSNETLEILRRTMRESAISIGFFDTNNRPVALALTPDIAGINGELANFATFDEFCQIFLPKCERQTSVECSVIEYLWDALDIVPQAIQEDMRLSALWQPLSSDLQRGVYIVGEVYSIGDSVISPGCVLDATGGPILLGDNASIMPNSTILGPCAIGNNSLIKAGSKIYSGTAIGDHCKMGGEIENSIVQDYSNKQHDGFLGHSFVSEWVNLGADTNTSDLKNTYSPISVSFRGKKIATERLFVGSLIGDHTKTAINTSLTTGSVVGICANIVTNDFPPAEIPSYSWGGKKNSGIYSFDRAIKVAEIVKQRRKQNLHHEEIALMKSEFEKVCPSADNYEN